MRHQHIRSLDDENKIPTSCAHDCGGKCLLYVHIQKGKITKISASTTLPRAIRRIPQRACIRGLTYHRRVYHPDRLKRPMRRIEEKGEGEFKKIFWDEALDEVAEILKRVREEYGNISILSLSSSGSYGAILHQTRSLTKRFLNMFGGHVELKGSFSLGAARAVFIYTYGTVYTDHSRDGLFNSRLIILWGWNPVVTIFGSRR